MPRLKDELKYRRMFIARGRDDRELCYGFPHVPDPRDFCPDRECSLVQERKNWIAACQQADAGETVDVSGNHHLYNVQIAGAVVTHMSRTMWGIGSYWYDVERA